MSPGLCFRCGADVPRREGHHILCRDELKRYVRPHYVRPYCVPCHLGVTQLLRFAGLEEPQPVTGIRIIGLEAIDFGWLAMADRPITFEPDELGQTAEALELGYRLLRGEDAL
jgi:hypothetical protein